MTDEIDENSQEWVLRAMASGKIAGIRSVDDGPLERIDTHSAIIFLGADRAYKVKRAVKFPYLDFSTLARRERFCRREVELNRRTAPGLYLGVEPLTHDRDGLHLAGDGDVVEWVIVMRRFDQDGLFDRLAETGRLDPALLCRAVDAIVAFHAAAAPATGPSLQWVVEENLEELRAAPELFPADGVADYAAASLAAFAEVRPLLTARQRAGWLRHGHGDLHLHNICLFDGAPVLFDCIEFNDRLACADVLYDFAFLLMDLVHRNLPGLANLALGRYVTNVETAQALAALNLFCSLRAAIRAKVGVPALQTAKDPDALKAEMAAYFDLARRFLAPVPARLVAVGGLSGTGKTTLAAALAPSLGGPLGALHLRTDIIRKRLAGVADDQRLPADSYTKAASDRVYAELERLAEAALAAGWPVILDAVFLDPAERQAAAAIAGRLGVPCDGLWLTAPADILRARVRGRRGDASDATADVVDRQLRHVGAVEDWRQVDAGADPDATVAAARAALVR